MTKNIKLLVLGLGYPTDIPNVYYSGGLDVVVANIYKHLPYRTVIFVRASLPPTDPPIRFAPAPHIRVNAVPVRSYRGREEAKAYNIANGNWDAITALDFCSTVMTEHVFPLLLLVNEKETIMHCHDWLTAKAITIIRKKDIKMPTVFSVHLSANRPPEDYLQIGQLVENVGLQNPDIRRKLDSIDRRLIFEAEGCHYADIVHAVSNATAEQIIRAYNLPREKVRVIHNGVDTQLYAPPSPAEEAQIDAVLRKYDIRKPFILSSGRFVLEKGHKELISSFAYFGRNHPEYMLVIFGFGGYTYNMLMDTVASLPKDVAWRVKVINASAREDLLYLYKACDIGAFPSHEEAFGLVATEVMSCGKPVVVGDVGGLREVVSDEVVGKVGVRVNGHSPESIADGLEKAHAHKEEWGQNARKYVMECFDWRSVAKKFMALYNELV